MLKLTLKLNLNISGTAYKSKRIILCIKMKIMLTICDDFLTRFTSLRKKRKITRDCLKG